MHVHEGLACLYTTTGRRHPRQPPSRPVVPDLGCGAEIRRSELPQCNRIGGKSLLCSWRCGGRRGDVAARGRGSVHWRDAANGFVARGCARRARGRMRAADGCLCRSAGVAVCALPIRVASPSRDAPVVSMSSCAAPLGVKQRHFDEVTPLAQTTHPRCRPSQPTLSPAPRCQAVERLGACLFDGYTRPWVADWLLCPQAISEPLRALALCHAARSSKPSSLASLLAAVPPRTLSRTVELRVSSFSEKRDCRGFRARCVSLPCRPAPCRPLPPSLPPLPPFRRLPHLCTLLSRPHSQGRAQDADGERARARPLRGPAPDLGHAAAGRGDGGVP